MVDSGRREDVILDDGALWARRDGRAGVILGAEAVIDDHVHSVLIELGLAKDYTPWGIFCQPELTVTLHSNVIAARIPPKVFPAFPTKDRAMAFFQLVCRACGHAFEVSTKGAIKDKQKHCPQCRSVSVRQTFGSFLRNGPLTSSGCGAVPTGGFG